jgi:hypothetical protein
LAKWKKSMKQLLLACALIVLPVGAFAVFNHFYPLTGGQTNGAVAAGLGDLTALSVIVTDTQAIAGKGDLVAAQKRITDFETAWDDATASLRPLNADQWGAIDDAADAAIGALRANPPAADKVDVTLAALGAALSDPGGRAVAAMAGGMAGGVQQVNGIVVSDANGRPLPCEEMLTALRAAVGAATLSGADLASANDFAAKATERCNADDDALADAFSAQGLVLVQK